MLTLVNINFLREMKMIIKNPCVDREGYESKVSAQKPKIRRTSPSGENMIPHNIHLTKNIPGNVYAITMNYPTAFQSMWKILLSSNIADLENE